jgi:LemA protein
MLLRRLPCVGGAIASMPLSSILPWLALALLLFWAVGAHNRLVRLRSAALQALGALGAAYGRHVALAAVAQDAVQLQAAARQFGVALATARARPLHRETLAALCTARDVLNTAWAASTAESVAAIAEAWEQAHGEQAEAERRFNAAVQAYGQAIDQFPAALLALVFGFKPARTV